MLVLERISVDLKQEREMVSLREGSEKQAQGDDVGLVRGEKEHVEEKAEGGVDAAVSEADGDSGVPGDGVAGRKWEEVEEFESVVDGLGFGCSREVDIGWTWGGDP